MKKTTHTTLATLGLLFALLAQTSKAAPLGTAITYQGKLNFSGSPADGSYDLKFTLFGGTNGGIATAGPLTNNAVGVANGDYTVTLDFGAVAFNGEARWMETAVRTNGNGAFTTLTPRQIVEPLPYALYAPNAGAVPATNITGTIPWDKLLSTPLTNNQAAVVLSGSFSGNGAGLTGVDAAMVGGLGPSAFWKTTGNAGTTPGTHFFGTSDNQALELKVNGQRALRLEPNTDGPNVIGGKDDNSIAASVSGAVIAGGSANSVGTSASYGTVSGGYSNTLGLTTYFSTIAGGRVNTIQVGGENSSIGGGYLNTIEGADYATIAGGAQNTILRSGVSATIGGGDVNTNGGTHATIAGGYVNSIQTNANYSTIGGGRGNTIESGSFYSTIAGGNANTALGDYSAVPGGYQNEALGGYGFAAGRQAKANHSGAFVWADAQAADFASTTNNQASFRCQGGVRFTTGIAGTNQTVSWTPGGASWSFSSDRELKEQFAPVDGKAVLEKLAHVPISEWSFKGHAQRHIGPMAQDFHSAFPLNESDTTLNDADLHGVALAAIQGLRQVVQDKDGEIQALKARLERLEQLLNSQTRGGQ